MVKKIDKVDRDPRNYYIMMWLPEEGSSPKNQEGQTQQTHD